ncbi:MAG TPA: T9SS type A sorting domain-containing protein [Ignavibacteriaceae bacterium]|nr:T9SS type A sorting domain-containing protein [Ignavibacteriaceae bacterium]
MKKNLILFFIALMSGITFGQLAPVDSVISGNITSNAVLSASKKYLLSGFVNVSEPATLTIPPGTIIYGEKDSKGTLIINRGAKINANGTKEKPIVFTSQQPAGQRGAGDWGGIILAGKAAINVPGGTATIEGGTGTIYGGGSSPNDDDNSGVMRYVRIEFPGIALAPDNEINGLTMGGVGRGTTLEYIQVSYCGDDSYEWFGGTVNAKYLVAINAVDDDFDVDFGFRGNVQFGFILRDPNIADISGSNGFESDNDNTGTFNTPRTKPIFSNVTIVGPMADTSSSRNPNYRRGAHIRRSSQTSIYNSIIMGYPVGLLIDGSGTVNSAVGDSMQIRNSIWAGLRVGNSFTTTVASFDADAWYKTASYGNRAYIQPSEVFLTNPFNLTAPNPVPLANSPAVTGASFANSNLSTFFAQTSYVGAFDPSGQRWDDGWTNYDPVNTSYLVGVENEEIQLSDFNLSQNYPNPFNPLTTINFTLPISSEISLKVFNTIGKEVATVAKGLYNSGNHSVSFDASSLSSGNYFYQLITSNSVITKKMTLIK